MICHQKKIRDATLEEDLKSLPFDHISIKAKDFVLEKIDKVTPEIVNFIKRYEWLGTTGPSPKWAFTARFNGILGGVVLMNEPTAYSKLLGKDTRKYEALIQRGACASWTPKNLGSRLVMFGCKWLTQNTDKRIFVAYSDPAANEIGTIYQACNFDYLGNDFGVKEMLVHPEFQNGKAFSAQSLRRTSTLKRWAKQNGINFDPSWLKSNGFKDLTKIPEQIKKDWYAWGNKIKKEAQKIKMDSKGKYALLLGKNKRELSMLEKLKNYEPKPYPKR